MSTPRARTQSTTKSQWLRQPLAKYKKAALTSLTVAVLTSGSIFAAGGSAEADTTYKVVVGERGLRVRDEPSTHGRIVGSLFSGDRVRIICTKADGTKVKGPLGTTSVWNMIGDNPERWVSDAFIKTHSSKPAAPPCTSNATDQSSTESTPVLPAQPEQQTGSSPAGSACNESAVDPVDREHYKHIFVQSSEGPLNVTVDFCQNGWSWVTGLQTPALGLDMNNPFSQVALDVHPRTIGSWYPGDQGVDGQHMNWFHDIEVEYCLAPVKPFVDGICDTQPGFIKVEGNANGHGGVVLHVEEHEGGAEFY